MSGPHEVLGMSRLLGVSTTEFLALYSDNSGTTLRSEADGRCVFVAPNGCRVHPRRPLVCRLYPLGRVTDEAGEERFGLFDREPGCEAETGREGTIETFLESQGVAPYLEWSRRYGEVYRRMMGLLDRLGLDGETRASDGHDGGREEASGQAGPTEEAAPEARVGQPDRALVSSWQDIDASLADYCAAKGLPVPDGIEASIDLHVQAMSEWLDDLESRLGPASD